MPVLTAATCPTSDDCIVIPMPTKNLACGTGTLRGGVDDLYFIPCTELLTEQNVISTTFWDGLKTGGKLGNIGLGNGSIAKKSDKKEKLGSGLTEQITSTTWGLKYVIKQFDKTSLDVTTEQINAILKRFRQFNVVARMCEGDETLLPIGRFTPSDFNWTVPESSEDSQMVELELSWIEYGKPKLYACAGLSAVLPKNS